MLTFLVCLCNQKKGGLSQALELLSCQIRQGDKMDDRMFEFGNDQLVIVPWVWPPLCATPLFATNTFHSILPLQTPSPVSKSNANLCPQHKGSLCEVLNQPHLPALTLLLSQVLSPSEADVLHLLNDRQKGTRQKFTHLSCSLGWDCSLTLYPMSLLAVSPPPLPTICPFAWGWAHHKCWLWFILV